MTISMQPGSSDTPCENSGCYESSTDATGTALAQTDGLEARSDMVEADFPLNSLERLEDMINRTKWVIPVLPGGELEVLLNVSIDFCRQGLDADSEPCQRFIRDGLVTSFTKVLTDDAVSGWKPEIHKCIFKNCEKLIELCVLKLPDDCFCLLDMLALSFNPQNKFHTFNSIKASEASVCSTAQDTSTVFAKSSDARVPRTWLIDLINLFGRLGGFRALLERFQTTEKLTVMLIYALLRPVGLCYEFLTVPTIEQYILPIVEIVPAFLEKLSDADLKKEAKNECKNDALSTIVRFFKNLVGRVPGQEEQFKTLEMFRLQMILRLLKVSSFNGKMNALNELNKVITNMAYYSHGRQAAAAAEDAEETLNAARMALWIKQNRVLQIVLCDSLHQPQYVEKLEKIVRFIIKERALTLDDLDCLWQAQCGRHEAIVKNVHDLLAKLAWDFSPEQLDHLFSRFSTSWVNASKKQREKLLELIRRLAEEDKDGVMAHKVLQLLWTLAHSDDLPNDIMDQALSAHLKILDCSCSQDRDAQKARWLAQCVGDLSADKWVLPALKQIRDICLLYQEAPPAYNHTGGRLTQHGKYRCHVVKDLQERHDLVCVISDGLTAYMRNVAQLKNTSSTSVDPATYCVDGRYNHSEQIEQRLGFLSFVLREGKLWLSAPQPQQIWNCLAERAVFDEDRELCFKWFCNLMSEGPDIEPTVIQQFFEHNILQLDPALLTESGIECFDRFFKAVNVKAGKLVARKRVFLMEHDDLIGLHYLWRVVMQAPCSVASRAIELLKEVYTNLGPRLRAQQEVIHRELIANCMNRLRACYDTISVLGQSADDQADRFKQAGTMYRVLSVLCEYIGHSDREYGDDRQLVPLFRAHCGKHVTVVLRLPTQGKNFDITVETHTQELLSSLRQLVLQRMKASAQAFCVELYLAQDSLELLDNKVCVGEVVDDWDADEVVLTAKLCSLTSGAATTGPSSVAAAAAGGNAPSSPDSSSDSSAPSPQHVHRPDCAGAAATSTVVPGGGGGCAVSAAAEKQLAGVIWSMHAEYVDFLLRLAELGCAIGYVGLRDAARGVLDIVPAAPHVRARLVAACEGGGSGDASLDALLFDAPCSRVLYCLQTLYSLLMPADDALTDKRCRLLQSFVVNGGGAAVLRMLSAQRFMASADACTKRLVFLYVVRLVKLVLATVGFVVCRAEQSVAGDAGAQCLQRSAELCLPSSDKALSYLALATAKNIDAGRVDCVALQLAHVQFLLKLVCWSCCWQRLVAGPDCELTELHAHMSTAGVADVTLCREALETLPLMLCVRRQLLDTLTRQAHFGTFVLDMVLLCGDRRLRRCACDQVMVVVSQADRRTLLFFVHLLFSVLEQLVPEHADTAREFFDLLCRLLGFACSKQVALSRLDVLLRSEIAWLHKLRLSVARASPCSPCDQHAQPDMRTAVLLEGHLKVSAALVAFLPSAAKRDVVSAGGCGLASELLTSFLLTHSAVLLQMERSGRLPERLPAVVCSCAETRQAAYDVLVALCTDSADNLHVVVELLTDMFYADGEDSVVDWDYTPPVGSRAPGGFVGLKNAGATCYMNSVLQQLFMIDAVRVGVLATQGVCAPSDEDLSGEERCGDHRESRLSDAEVDDRRCESLHEYNVGILKWLQVIFGHLLCSQLQSYVPRGLWTHFKLQGEPVNLREQHDAIEFFISLVDSVDEAQKALGQPQVMSRQLRGTFSDQKICKQCPHRYSKEETFTVLNVDIHNFNSLTESLDQYVKGDLLEGPNAYHCDKCNRKVDTVKRTCIKKLPPTLCIQLKRFDYDWERECAIKFNDHFEFPRRLDMEPYTARGLARIEGELIGADVEEEEQTGESGRAGGVGLDAGVECSSYLLTGVVVHSGQASGGHYYSYVLHRASSSSCSSSSSTSATADDTRSRWYKFDDCDVSECNMDDDEELKTQCFGGEYFGEVFDQMMKRTSSRRQKRWWNAYILFYTRHDTLAASPGDDAAAVESSFGRLSLDGATASAFMPASIQRSILRQNIRFLSARNKFHSEYVRFIRRLALCNSHIYQMDKFSSGGVGGAGDQMAVLSVSLACRFLFSVGWHMKKVVRGSASDWHDALAPHLAASSAARVWLANHVLFQQPPVAQRFSEYLLECPAAEVRLVFARLLVLLARYGTSDVIKEVRVPALGQLVYHVTDNLSEAVLLGTMSLLRKEVSDHCRHLPQYFGFFQMYAGCGGRERARLLKLHVPATFMLMALDEGPAMSIKSQYADLSKLYQCVSLLVRCCNVTPRCASRTGAPPLSNAYGEDMSEVGGPVALTPQLDDLLYVKSTYVKKLIEDASGVEDVVSLLRYCCWENMSFSYLVLKDLLGHIAYGFNLVMRHHLDLLLSVLLLDDSWQMQRAQHTLEGMRDVRGVLETIDQFRNHHQKRAYFCVKFVVELFMRCPLVHAAAMANTGVRRRWCEAVQWFKDELERRPVHAINVPSGGGGAAGTQYGAAWSSTTAGSSTAHSNETSNGYYLERSPSAEACLDHALMLYPDDDEDEEQDDQEEYEENEEGDDDDAVSDHDVSPAAERDWVVSRSAAPASAATAATSTRRGASVTKDVAAVQQTSQQRASGVPTSADARESAGVVSERAAGPPKLQVDSCGGKVDADRRHGSPSDNRAPSRTDQ